MVESTLMEQFAYTSLSAREQQAITEGQLGPVRKKYAFKKSYNRVVYGGMGVLCVATGLVRLVSVFLISLRDGPEPIGFIPLLSYGLSIVFFMIGIFSFWVYHMHTYMGVIVCENGFLYPYVKISRPDLKVVHWNDVISLYRDLLDIDFHVTYKDRSQQKTLHFHRGFEDADELIEVLKQKTQIVEE